MRDFSEGEQENQPILPNPNDALQKDLDEIVQAAENEDSIVRVEELFRMLARLYEAFELDASNGELEAIMAAMSAVTARKTELNKDDFARARHQALKRDDEALIERDAVKDEGVMTYTDDVIAELEKQFQPNPSQND